MCKIISVINHKGGVGKTTTTVNLSVALARKGKRVLLVDFDPQANLTRHLGAEEVEINTIADSIIDNKEFEVHALESCLDIVCGDVRLNEAESKYAQNARIYHVLKGVLKPIKSNYDIILIDCPPALGFFTMNALNASTHVIVPCEASLLSTDGLDSIFNLIEDIKDVSNENLELAGILITNFKSLVVQKSFAQQMRSEFKDLIFNTNIRSYKHYAEAAALQTNIYAHAIDSKAVEDFDNLTKEIYERLHI